MSDDPVRPPPSDPLEADLFRWVSDFNLNHIVRFHNRVQALLEDSLPAAGSLDEPIARPTIELYDKMNSANSLLIALAFLEEMLALFWRRRFPGVDIPERTTIDRYKPLLHDLRVDLGSSSCWAVVRDALTIRNCLLHANGRVSLTRRSVNIRPCIARYPGELEINLDRVRVTSFFLQRCIVAIRELREQMLNGLAAH